MKKDPINKIITGDVRNVAAKLPRGFVQTIVTSPPYFGHRDYSEGLLTDKEIGREKNFDDYVKNLVDVFEAVKPVLRDDGLLWLNLGDTYRNGRQLGVPWTVALELQKNGWYLRSDIIWNKPNAMPSSVKTRPTTSHEYIFLLSKNKDYYYDADAIREPHVTFSENSKMKGGRNHLGKRNGTPENGKNKGNNNLHDGRWDQAFHPKGRNKRTVWDISLGKFRGAHFAVFPEKLVETCILASTKKGDIVMDPFMGAGTTAIVAVKNNRNYLGVELLEKYAEIANERISETQKTLL